MVWDSDVGNVRKEDQNHRKSAEQSEAPAQDR